MHVDQEVQEDEDGFATAFNELHGEPAEKAGVNGEVEDQSAGPEKEPAEKEGAEPAPTEQAQDPWAGASPELLAERDRLIGERDRYKHSDQSQRGRIAALQRQISQRSAPPQQEQPQGGADEDQGGKDGEPEKDTKAERLKQLREDYPDLAGPILDLIDEARKEAQAIGDRVTPVIDASNEAAVQAQEDALATKHPDWREIGGSDDFAGWAASQSPQVQALCASYDASEVSAALTLFKTERDASKAKGGEPGDKPDPNLKPQDNVRDDRREKQLNGGRERPSRGPSSAAGAPDEFDEAFNYFADRRKRQQSGR